MLWRNTIREGELVMGKRQLTCPSVYEATRRKANSTKHRGIQARFRSSSSNVLSIKVFLIKVCDISQNSANSVGKDWSISEQRMDPPLHSRQSKINKPHSTRIKVIESLKDHGYSRRQGIEHAPRYCNPETEEENDRLCEQKPCKNDTRVSAAP
jgi:hypothetical protein